MDTLSCPWKLSDVDTLMGKQFCHLHLCLPLKYGSSLKGKTLLPVNYILSLPLLI